MHRCCYVVGRQTTTLTYVRFKYNIPSNKKAPKGAFLYVKKSNQIKQPVYFSLSLFTNHFLKIRDGSFFLVIHFIL